MKSKKNTTKIMEHFFKEMGLEDEMKRLTELFSQNFMISGEITEDLKESLHRAPDSLIDMIWEKTEDDNITGEVDREEKERALFQHILEDLEVELLYMDPKKLELLLRVMNQYPIELMETTIVNEEFVPRGWVFQFIENNNCTFVVMDQVRQVIMSIEKEDMKNKMAFTYGVRYMINTCLRLYGVFKKEYFINLYKDIVLKGNEQTSESLKIEENIELLLQIFEKQNIIWLDEEYIVSTYFKTKEEYRQLLIKQKGKEYYIPNDRDIKTYAMGDVIEKNKEYETVYKCLIREIKDTVQVEEMLQEIAEKVVTKDWGIPQIMNCFYQWQVSFDKIKSAENMTRALSDWTYDVRRWSECGYNRKEKGLPNIENEQITLGSTINRVAVSNKKIYPNDSCSCGSGKKYKKCCGKGI